MSGFALTITVQVLSFIESTKDAAVALRYIFRLIPAYCLGEALTAIAVVPPQRELGVNISALDWDVVGAALVYMACEFPVFMLLTVFFDNPRWLKSQQMLQHDTQQDGDHTDTSNEDPDVAKERKEVLAGRDTDLVTVKSLRKVWPTPKGPKVAVRYLTFGVKRAEIFGFLGTNGAGKTTTLSILSGEFPPTSGEGYLHGFDVVSDCANARRHLGYCPQFDALLDLLTPREHLNLFSALRGVPSHRVKPSVDALLTAACLDTYADQPSGGLSGGNKRKLSLAIALIGGPPVIFLDEPSAGMDPVARRSLWGTIRAMAEGRSVVLTTHHLEEVEALAQRVTIMDRGEMKCIGSLQHLKNKFGDGYELTVKANDLSHISGLTAFIAQALPSAVLDEVHGLRVTFLLPQRDTVLSHVFDLVEGGKSTAGITDYSVTQTSLEQVFLRIAQAGIDAENQEMKVIH
jgi:ABC-type multidrug transport system ATPase subunit